jgi:hypothetical protein
MCVRRWNQRGNQECMWHVCLPMESEGKPGVHVACVFADGIRGETRSACMWHVCSPMESEGKRKLHTDVSSGM